MKYLKGLTRCPPTPVWKKDGVKSGPVILEPRLLATAAVCIGCG